MIGECGEDKHGTKVTFWPDASIFEETVFDYDTLKQRLRETAFLTKGLRIVLTDLRENPVRTYDFHYAGGITSAAMDGLKVAEAILKKFKIK